MSKLIKFSGILGTVLFLFGVLGALIVGFDQAFMVAHMLIGLVLITLGLTSGGLKGVSQKGQVLRGRNMRFGANVALYSAVFIGLLAVVNWAANRFDKRWDMTSEGVFSLSQQSFDLVKNLQIPLKLVSIIGAGGNDDGNKDLLNLFKYANPSKVKVEFVDPRTKPHLIDKYGLKPGNIVYVGLGEEGKEQVNRLNDSSEEAITNAILKLTRGASKKIYYIQGHDEPDLDAESAQGIKYFKDAIGDENFAVEGLLLSQKGAIPEDAAAVLVVSPKRAMLKEEKESLMKYADQGGRLLLFADPRTTDDLKELADHFGIEIGQNVVIDQVQRLFAAPALGAQPICTDYGVHPITKSLKKTDVTIFNIASSVKPGATKKEGATYTELVKTGPNAWGESNLSQIFESDEPSAIYDPESDVKGPVTVAVSYEKKLSDEKKEGEKSADGKNADAKFDKATRVVVFGDSDWILNPNLSVYANRDLALNALNWAIGEEGGITIRPKAIGASFARISRETFSLILATSFMAPELLLILGLFVWWRRRTVSV